MTGPYVEIGPADLDGGWSTSHVAPREVVGALAAAAVLTAGLVGIAAWHGALGAARNDDWAYLRSATVFAADGTFVPESSTAMLVGQTVLAWPLVRLFGAGVAPLQIAVAILGALGLVAAYLVVRRVVPRGWSAFAVGCLALGPLYGSLGVSFMTDVPAFAFEMFALLAGVRALAARHHVVAWYAASLTAGFVAFSIREYAVAAPLAVSGALLVRQRARRRRPREAWALAGLAGVWAAGITGIFVWRRGVVGAVPVLVDAGRGRPILVPLIAVVFTLGLLAAPVVPLVSLDRLLTALRACPLRAVTLASVTCMAWGRLAWGGGHGVLLGNYVTTAGSYSDTLPGVAPAILSPLVFGIVEAAALAGALTVGLLALARVVATVRPVGRTPGARPRLVLPDGPEVLVLMFCVLTLGILAAAKLVANAPLFDRNLVPIVPFVVALAVRATLTHQVVVRRRALAATLGLAAFTVFGLGMVDASATFDGAKRDLAQTVVAAGYDPAAIDGGYEWFSGHQPGLVVAIRPEAAGTNWWVRYFPERPICVTSRFGGVADLGPRAAGREAFGVRARSLLGARYDLVAVPDLVACPTGR